MMTYSSECACMGIFHHCCSISDAIGQCDIRDTVSVVLLFAVSCGMHRLSV